MPTERHALGDREGEELPYGDEGHLKGGEEVVEARGDCGSGVSFDASTPSKKGSQLTIVLTPVLGRVNVAVSMERREDEALIEDEGDDDLGWREGVSRRWEWFGAPVGSP